MSKHEVKEELRQAEGDRMIKARLRSLRLDRSRKRMLSAVPRATMIVVNPTHYAVALRYVRAEGGAPMVLAKGADFIALKIRSIAEEHAIPVVEDQPLARSLYAAVDVDRPIPAEFYRAVAEIVHLIQQRKGQWAQRRH
jgi:flagellar biosynthetic protein FlhB